MSGYFAWSAFAFSEIVYLGCACILSMTAIGVLTRQIWAQYFVFAYTFAAIMFWCLIAFPAAWMHEPEYTILPIIVALVPWITLSVFLLILCWQVYRGFRAEPDSGRAE